jgi:hypothetical protein
MTEAAERRPNRIPEEERDRQDGSQRGLDDQAAGAGVDVGEIKHGADASGRGMRLG